MQSLLDPLVMHKKSYLKHLVRFVKYVLILPSVDDTSLYTYNLIFISTFANCRENDNASALSQAYILINLSIYSSCTFGC